MKRGGRYEDEYDDADDAQNSQNSQKDGKKLIMLGRGGFG